MRVDTPSGNIALAALAWPDVERRAAGGAVLLVPLGATEQHGPHLPLSTDTDIASVLCEHAAAGADTDTLVAPPLPYGASDEHHGFAGTLSIGTEALAAVLAAIGRWAYASFSRVVFVSAHGGNADAIARAVESLAHDGIDAQVFAPSGFRDAHAGHSETALQLAIAPGRVARGAAVPGNTTALADLMPALVAGGVRSVSPTGILGDPTGATAADGNDLLASMVAALVDMIDARPDAASTS